MMAGTQPLPLAGPSVHYDQATLDRLIEKLDRLSLAELDALPCGLIKVDLTGKVLAYNKTESELSRLSPSWVIGKNFFTEIAPCAKVKEFHGRFLAGVARGALNETFAFLFRFEHGHRHMAITLYYSRAVEAVYLVVSLAPAVGVP